MQNLIVILSLFGAAFALIRLIQIDLKHWLLPNTYVLAFGLFGIAFHAGLDFSLLSSLQMIGGLVMGGGFLAIIRFFGNMAYKQETLGLGDVKLLMAAGLWLGAESTLFAIIIGAMAGLLHGAGIALFQTHVRKNPVSMKRMALPAGPGFIAGIIGVFLFEFWRVF